MLHDAASLPCSAAWRSPPPVRPPRRSISASATSRCVPIPTPPASSFRSSGCWRSICRMTASTKTPIQRHLGRLHVGRTDHQPDARRQAGVRRHGRLPPGVNGAKFQATDSLRSLYVAGPAITCAVPATASSCRSSPTSIHSTSSRATRSRRRSAPRPGAC